jgi:hypothetical protein
MLVIPKDQKVRFINQSVLSHACFVLAAFSLLSIPAVSQENTTSTQAQNESTIEGTVASSTRQSFVVRTPENQFYLFTFNLYTDKPQSLPIGTRVRVESRPGGDTGSRLAIRVTTLEAAPKDQQRAAGTDACPDSRVGPQRGEQHQERSPALAPWGAGRSCFRSGTLYVRRALADGPYFQFARFLSSSAEFDFGEVTDLIALNLEAIYRFPRSSERRDWSPYVGGGPALTFIHQSFQAGRDINFGNFDFDAGFNILAGMQSRRGTFVEAKTSLWSRPAPCFG